MNVDKEKLESKVGHFLEELLKATGLDLEFDANQKITP